MNLATYKLSSPLTPRQFANSSIIGEGKLFSPNLVVFGQQRTGNFRASLNDYWGVIYFHPDGRMDVEIDYIDLPDLRDILRVICTTFFVRMELIQPLKMGLLPKSVGPGEELERRES